MKNLEVEWYNRQFIVPFGNKTILKEIFLCFSEKEIKNKKEINEILCEVRNTVPNSELRDVPRLGRARNMNSK